MATKKAAKTVTRTVSKPVTRANGPAKKASPVSTKGVHLPNGYKVIGRVPNWDMEEHPIIEGERSDAREVVFDEGTKKERTLRTMTVVDETIGAVSVWEATGTRDLFDQTEPGDVVRIEFLGLAAKVKGKNQMRLFSCSVKE
jgi:hypothetical protein